MGGRRGALLLALGVGLIWPAAAWGDKEIQAAPSNRYTEAQYNIDQGERLMFRNNDLAGHDVTANEKDPGGKPLFATPIIERGESAFVEGSQYLVTGHYTFICSVHPSMAAHLHVSANGTPQPRPGGGSGSTGTGAADKNAPTVGVRVLSGRVSSVRGAGELLSRVSLDEGGRVTLRAVARPEAGGKLVTVARGSVRLTAAGTRVARLRLTRAGRQAIRRKRGLAVIVTASAKDTAGNPGRATHGRTLRA